MRPTWEKPPYNVQSFGFAGQTLTNVGATYDSSAPGKKCGFAVADFTNATGVEWSVKWMRVGTGTLFFQLWNETDGAQLGEFSDAAAAGVDRQNTVVIPVNLSGLKRIRLRSRSTVAGDDPELYGWGAVLS